MLRQPQTGTLLQQLPAPGGATRVGGLAGSSPALLVSALATSLPNRVWVVVSKDPPDADSTDADLQSVLGAGLTALYPQRETLPYEASETHIEVSVLRVEAHLTRQLESALALFGRLAGRPAVGLGVVVAGLGRVGNGGFVPFPGPATAAGGIDPVLAPGAADTGAG